MIENGKEGLPTMPDEEVERIHDYEMKCILPDGLGYGVGSISTKAREASGESPVSPEQLRRAVELILNHREEIIAPIEEDDDGCGDGRPTDNIVQKDIESDLIVTFNKSKLRVKLFGGGLLVAASMWRAINGAAQNGETVLGDRKFIAEELKKRGIHHGAHTDNHAQGENCGCGAIDKYERSVGLSNDYRERITGSMAGFIENPSENPGVTQTFVTRNAIAGDASYMANASGRATMDLILDQGSVVKELSDDHNELIIIMNDEPGTTSDQDKIAEILRDANLPENIQVFTIAIWRGRQYAEIVADIAAEHGFDRQVAQETALADFFVQQLAVSTTLTQGDLPVILNN